MIQSHRYERQQEPAEVDGPRGPWYIRKEAERKERRRRRRRRGRKLQRVDRAMACSLWEQKTKARVREIKC